MISATHQSIDWLNNAKTYQLSPANFELCGCCENRSATTTVHCNGKEVGHFCQQHSKVWMPLGAAC